jgi:hypothetical protein
MKVDLKSKERLPEQPEALPQLKVRSGLRAGANQAEGDCSLGIGYWRKEYNYWKSLAQSMGCV